MLIFKHAVSRNSNRIFPLDLQLTFHETAQTRLRHTVAALSLGPGWTQVIMFGGSPKWKWGKSVYAQQQLAKTTVLEFGEQTHKHNMAFFFFFSVLISFPCVLNCLNIVRFLLD